MVSDAELTQILKESHKIAIVGISSNPTRPSFNVSSWLIRQGFQIIPVNPAEKEVHGQKAYSSLKDIPFPVDIVDVFRRSDQVLPIVEDAVAIKPRLIILQEGVYSEDAAKVAGQSGVPFVMDRCILKELGRLLPRA